ncbi:16882_t:CDS:2, partial [Racocetra persica]
LKHSMLFNIVNQGNWIPDELHTMLRILDILLQYAFYELSANRKNFAKTISKLIIAEMSQIDPDKLKILQNFQISKFFNLNRGKEIERLWREFYRLYNIICQQNLTDIEIDKFGNDAKQWIKDFSRPTIGKFNSPNQQQGMYSKKNVIPYMHMLAQHMPKFMRNLKNKGLLLRLFSTSSLKKKKIMNM